MKSDLLYKVATLIRGGADRLRDRFIHSLPLPSKNLCYSLTYRCGPDAANQSELQ